MVNQVAASRFLASDLPQGRVAVMFTADWCGYCRPFLRHFKRIHQAWVVDASDDDDPVWDTLRIRVVPTVILFQDGVPLKRWEGVLGEGHVLEIEAALRENAGVQNGGATL